MDSHSPGEVDVPEWVWAEWQKILKDRDNAYVANCAQWWTASGPMHAYMKRYKNYLITERIPHEKKYGDQPKLDHYKSMNVSTEGWRTTSDYEAAEDYMKMARTLFNARALHPRCSASGCG
jgi:hypothetical protein